MHVVCRYQPFSFQHRLTRYHTLQVAPLALFWWLYVVSGVTALRYLNVPMYGAFRRSTTLVVVAGEYFMFKTLPSPKKLVSCPPLQIPIN